jgi:class 3 adenylate cyclase
MWLFATPIMLKMYCDINHLRLHNINIQYHVTPIAINLFIHPYKGTAMYYYFTAISWGCFILFMKTLYRNRNLAFTNMFFFIWTVYMCINLLDVMNLVERYEINLYYSFADMISKLMACIILNDYNERELAQRNDMDLQSVQFVSYILKYIGRYKDDNSCITTKCSTLIVNTLNRFLAKIPDNKAALEEELLRKILPLGFEKEYFKGAGAGGAGAGAGAGAKHFHMICVLFTDIVNYTELAKKYDDTIIFQLLYNIYTSFDNTIKKYPHLQKIETIGDAYMVVGDIFRNSINHKIVVKEIILFALEIMREIKTIHTPDNTPLSIRIGINLGNVSIGILGNEIPRLCVVGNTVNMAARLQSTADIDTIQFSRHIYEQVQEIEFNETFEIVQKENVFLKNMGSVTTYNIHLSV